MKRQPARQHVWSRRGRVGPSLHRAKLRRPATAEHYVRRSRLLDLFEEVVRNRLTLVVAPAGTGKTSLVAGWVAESSTPTAWLSLDDTDRDGVQFWSAVIAALDDVGAGMRRPRAGDAAPSRHPGRRGGPADRRSGGPGSTAGGARHRRLPPGGRRRLRARVGVALRAEPAGVAPRRADVAAGAEVADRSDEVARSARRDPLRRVAVLTGRGGRADDPAVADAVRGTHRGGRATRRWLGRRACSWRRSRRVRVERRRSRRGQVTRTTCSCRTTCCTRCWRTRHRR